MSSPPAVSPEIVRFVEEAIAREVPKRDRCVLVAMIAGAGIVGGLYSAWSGDVSFGAFFASLAALGAILVAHYCPSGSGL